MNRALLAAALTLPLGTARAVEPPWFAEFKASYEKANSSGPNQPPMPVASTRPASSEYNDWPNTYFPWAGVSLVWDDVNSEILYLGGHHGGREFGDLGWWASSDAGKTWRIIPPEPSPALAQLRTSALMARKPAKDAEGIARGIFYSAHELAQEVEMVKGKPAQLTARALQQVASLVHRLTARKGQEEAFTHPSALAARAMENLKSAHAAFAAGKLDAAALRACFDAQWALDEVSDCLASWPSPRERASSVFDSESRSVFLFGGSHQDFMYNDTWRYDCVKKTWRQLWPKTAPTARMGAAFSAAGGKLTLSGGETVLDKMEYQKGEKPAPAGEWVFDPKSGEWTGAGGAPPGTRIYRSIVPAYDPRWYDAAPRGSRAETEAWLAALKPNTWTACPRSRPRPPNVTGAMPFSIPTATASIAGPAATAPTRLRSPAPIIPPLTAGAFRLFLTSSPRAKA